MELPQTWGSLVLSHPEEFRVIFFFYDVLNPYFSFCTWRRLSLILLSWEKSFCFYSLLTLVLRSQYRRGTQWHQVTSWLYSGSAALHSPCAHCWLEFCQSTRTSRSFCALLLYGNNLISHNSQTRSAFITQLLTNISLRCSFLLECSQQDFLVLCHNTWWYSLKTLRDRIQMSTIKESVLLWHN